MSMTGYGEARCETPSLAVAVEVRAVNSKYFKISIRTGERSGSLEPQIETFVRRRIKRGTVLIDVRTDRQRSPDDYRINTDVLVAYRRQLDALSEKLHVADSISLESLLALPGVVNEDAAGCDTSQDWPVVRRALEEALEKLSAMRAEEGGAMAADLRTNCETITTYLDRIDERSPQVLESYRKRLIERLNKILDEHDVSLEPADVIREITIFTERSDVSEELVRLRSHLDQFAATLDEKESSGRKLEFVTQEMYREANTIGSKANDPEVSQHVIEIKAAIERVREMVQNVE